MGLFITFEGPDGTGKTTNAQLLEEFLKSKGCDCLRTREPGGTKISEKIREILLNKDNGMSSQTEALLYAAARQEIVLQVILPALNEGKVVICDRFYDSSIAYQGYGRELGEEYIRNINSAAIKMCEPDITFLLWSDEECTNSRVGGREKDRLEQENKEFFDRVRYGFLKIYEKEKERVVYIDAQRPLKDVAEEIATITIEKLKSKL